MRSEKTEDCLQDISGGTEGDGRRQERLHCDPALPGLGLRADHHQDLLGQEPLHTGQEQGEHEHHLVQTDLSVKGPYRVAPPALYIEPAHGTKTTNLGHFLPSLVLYSIRVAFTRRPHVIKNQQKARNAPVRDGG